MATAVKMTNISKSFPGVKALEHINIEVVQGEVHALVGENGAGKSTLIKILAGAYEADEGEIEVFGKRLNGITPHKMIMEGVAVIYQELMLTDYMTVAENVFLGSYPRTSFGLIQKSEMIRRTKDISRSLDLDIDPSVTVDKLSVAQKQMVEIIKAVSKNARVLVLDEPTAVLGEKDLEGLFALVKTLRARGVACIYISHRLQEIFTIADRVTVLKDGRWVTTDQVSNMTEDLMVKYMVGRELEKIYPPDDRTPGDEAISVKGLSAGFVRDVSFSVRAGEIFGIAGLAGAGRTEILRAIVGADKKDAGDVFLFGEQKAFHNPKSALMNGVGLLPEERKTQGLFVKQNIKYNFSISRYKKFMKRLLISSKAERGACMKMINDLNVKPPKMEFLLQNMSGGNQQKVVLGKLLNAECRVLLIDEPTRGVDVGAKQEIYKLMNKLAHQGVAIIMVSSELPEILGMSDRIGVMLEGKLVTVIDKKDADEEIIMNYCCIERE